MTIDQETAVNIDRVLREWLPEWLHLAGLHEHAEALRQLLPVSKMRVDPYDDATDLGVRVRAAVRSARKAVQCSVDAATKRAAGRTADLCAVKAAAWSALQTSSGGIQWPDSPICTLAWCAAWGAAEAAAWEAARSTDDAAGTVAICALSTTAARLRSLMVSPGATSTPLPTRAP